MRLIYIVAAISFWSFFLLFGVSSMEQQGTKPKSFSVGFLGNAGGNFVSTLVACLICSWKVIYHITIPKYTL